MQSKYDRLFGNTTEKSDFWPSFTDMLTTILLVIILVFTAMVGSYTTMLEEIRNELEVEKENVLEQARQLEETEKALQEAQETIVGIIGIRGDIIEALEKSLEENNIGVRIDTDTGDIHVDSNILFEYGSAELKEEAKAHLDIFVPLYMEGLLNYEENIEEIIVEGHTDRSGSYMYNLQLSQDRALSVVNYILGESFDVFKQGEQIRSMITANGRSFSQPVLKEDGTMDDEASRRVVFKFRTTLENALKEGLGSYIEENE